jgi:hypothetical protein
VNYGAGNPTLLTNREGSGTQGKPSEKAWLPAIGTDKEHYLKASRIAQRRAYPSFNV